MNRTEILNAALACVTKDRAATHGDAENNFEAIALIWRGLDMARGNRPREASDVALYLAGLKLARASGNPDHDDNWVDGSGYPACGGEIAARARIRRTAAAKAEPLP